MSFIASIKRAFALLFVFILPTSLVLVGVSAYCIFILDQWDPKWGPKPISSSIFLLGFVVLEALLRALGFLSSYWYIMLLSEEWHERELRVVVLVSGILSGSSIPLLFLWSIKAHFFVEVFQRIGIFVWVIPVLLSLFIATSVPWLYGRLRTSCFAGNRHGERE